MPAKIIPSIIFFPAIIFIGIITSYEDFKSSKIRNKWVVGGLVYSLIIYLFSWTLYVLTKENILNHFIREKFTSYFLWNFDKWCINLIISILVAYLIWHFRIWGAGDAKLFIAYAALIPMSQYSRVYFNYNFASFLLLLSIFIPATLYLFLKASFYFIKKNNLAEIKYNMLRIIKEKVTLLKIVELVRLIFGFFVFFLFFRILSFEFKNLVGKKMLDQNLLLLISILIFRQFSKIFKKKVKFVFFIFLILTVYLWFKIQFSAKGYILLFGNSLIMSILIVIIFPLIKKIINIYLDNTMHKTTSFAIWMFFGALVTWFF